MFNNISTNFSLRKTVVHVNKSGNIAFLPSALLLYKENGISLKSEIFDKKTLGKDILIGVIAFVCSAFIGMISEIPYYIPGIMETSLACPNKETGLSVHVMEIIALVFVSGLIKEIYFRGLAKRFCGPVFGEIAALVMFNVMFAVLDWHNLGHSLLIGFVWAFAYKKTGHLITPMICHFLTGLASVLAGILAW